MITELRPRGRSPAFAGVGSLSKQVVIGMLLVIALFAFEIFNFDTTEFALESLLGSASFVGVKWATVLAIAFCAIDFAGLARIFTPTLGAESGGEEPKEVWYLTGAWLMGATMNAVMTWWAVSITLLGHELGNEILSRGQILTYVPIFVAVLVWLTRIMFIGAMSVAGGQLFWQNQGVSATVSVDERFRQSVLKPATIRPAERVRQPRFANLDRPESRLNREAYDVPVTRAIRPRTQYRRMASR